MSADARRETVLVVAVAEFARTGLQGTSTEKIAAGAGISIRTCSACSARRRSCSSRASNAASHGSPTCSRGPPRRAARRGDRLEAMGHAYVDLLADREMLQLQLQTYAACADPEVREAASRGYAELWQLVARLSGAPEEDVRGFFATGMLLNLAAAMDLPQIAGDPGWALAHLRAQAEAGGAA